jgi:membrane protein YqaA with SNARE-associated domain
VVSSRFPRIKPERWHRTRSYFEDRGGWILMLSAVPGLGVVLSTTAGVFGLRVAEFVLWVTIGRGLRNWLVLILAVEIYRSAM